MTFAAGQEPSVNGFWSLTLYNNIIVVFRFHLGVLTVFAACSALGLLYGFLGGIG